MTTETTTPALDRGLHLYVVDDSHYVVRDGAHIQVGRCGHERDDPRHSDIENQTLGETK